MSGTPQDIEQPAPLGVNQDNNFLLDLLIALAKHKKMIAAVTFGAAVLSVGISLLLPNTYTGIARVLPPQQSQSSAVMLLGQLTGLTGLTGSSLGLKNPNDLYVGMLKSRTVADNIIGQFGLQKLYDLDTMVETRKELADNTVITAGRDGLITIEFDDEDPKRAAAVANAYVDALGNLTQSLAVTEAAQRRLFFEQQLQKARQDLGAAEVALKETQERTGLIKLDDQGKAIIEAVATLRAQIAAKEVELQALRTFTTRNNPEYVRAQQQLAGLQGELAKLERSSIAGEGDILLPTGKVPEAGLEYLRRYRAVRYQETIFELLAKQFEAAKIDEAKDAALIQILDRAVEPDKKSGPKRAVIVVLSLLFAVFGSVILALLLESVNRARRNPSSAERLDKLLQLLRLGAKSPTRSSN